MGTHLLESSLDMESASSSLGVHRFSCSTIDLQYDIFFTNTRQNMLSAFVSIFLNILLRRLPRIHDTGIWKLEDTPSLRYVEPGPSGIKNFTRNIHTYQGTPARLGVWNPYTRHIPAIGRTVTHRLRIPYPLIAPLSLVVPVPRTRLDFKDWLLAPNSDLYTGGYFPKSFLYCWKYH